MEQKRIAVFDFDEADCACLAEAVGHWYTEAGALVVRHTAMQPFVQDFMRRRGVDEPYDMVFIGVDDMQGVEVARSIREMDNWCPMFIVSHVEDYALEGFRLHALDYLKKPVPPQRVGRAVGRIGEQCQAGSQWP